MKKNARYWVLIGIAFVLTFGEVNIFAQTRWIPRTVSFSAPAMMRYYYGHIDNCAGITNDSSKDFKDIVGLSLQQNSPQDSIASYSQVDSTISITYGNQYWTNGETDISYDLDTNARQLINFRFHFKRDETKYCGCTGRSREISIRFAPIDYQIKDDSIIAVDYHGQNCKDNINSLFFYFETDRADGHCRYLVEEEKILYELDDTSTYKFFLNFVLRKPASLVQQPNGFVQLFSISTSLPHHAIDFTFPISNHPQQLMIYDILGREVSRIEIPAGSSSYQMSSIGYPKGTYFARLGESTAHFQVY